MKLFKKKKVITAIVTRTLHGVFADPGMAMDLELSITGSEPGKVDKTLYCYVMNLEEPLHLHVEAEFKVIINFI